MDIQTYLIVRDTIAIVVFATVSAPLTACALWWWGGGK